MNDKIKSIVLTVLSAVILLTLSVWCIVKPGPDYSDSERRVLASFPEITWENILSADFMSDFEDYTVDRFPMRDLFRSVKALSEKYVFVKKDNNDIYTADGHLSKLEYPLSFPMLDNAAEKFLYIYEKYIEKTDSQVYFSIVPDKNYFLAEKNGYLSLDYKELVSYMKDKTSYMTYIDIIDKLSIDDYYTTDTHWRQENITDVAEYIGECMGADVKADYTVNTLDKPFYGVYYGQSALPFRADTLKYLTSETLDNCIVTSYDTGKPVKKSVYDMEEAYGKDPYEMFMSGSDALIVCENPLAETDRELVMFRDSFSGSLSPLLAEGYSKITLVDIRYINPAMLGAFVDFENCDVLFIYSTMLLNSSSAFK